MQCKILQYFAHLPAEKCTALPASVSTSASCRQRTLAEAATQAHTPLAYMYRSLTLSCSLTCISLVCFARFVLNLNYTWRACKCFRQRIARCLSFYIRFACTAIRRPCMNFQQNKQLSLPLCSCVCTQYRHEYMSLYVCLCAVSKQAGCGCCYSCRLGWVGLWAD